MQTYEFEGPSGIVQFVGELPAGQRAMTIFHEVSAIAKQIGAFEITDAASIAYQITALAGLPKAKALALQTLAGWKVDGREVTGESFDDLFCRRGMWLAPYAIVIRIWRESGFFGG